MADGPPHDKRIAALLASVEQLATMAASLSGHAAGLVTRPHPLLVALTRGEFQLVFAPAAVWDHGRELLKGFAYAFAQGRAMLLVVGDTSHPDVEDALDLGVATILPSNPGPAQFRLAVLRAFELLEVKSKAEAHERLSKQYDYEFDELIQIGRAITAERDIDKLLGLVLQKSRFLTGADAGSIYVVEDNDTEPKLRFKLTQNDSLVFDSREFVMPLSRRSISGTAAIEKRTINIEDVYQLPADSPFGFDKSFDQKIGYRTRSMLVIPLISQRGDTIGVIQLINKKRDPRLKLLSEADVMSRVIPFDARSEGLLRTLSVQAGASLEAALLYDEIHRLFEGFVRASVEAIESRDPTTSGHSRRVADLTVGLAKSVDHEISGPYKEVTFSREDLRELEYASLLHDFGKIGVRERVLVKAKKLYEEEFAVVRQRFDYARLSIEADVLRKQLRVFHERLSLDSLDALDKERRERIEALEAYLNAVAQANEPTVLSSGDFEKIETLARETFVDVHGEAQPLLTCNEVSALCVRRGSLTEAEVDEIRSHVAHTYRFLSRIPWGKALRRVPVIAGAHHERLNGTGYPNRWQSVEIPLQSKMMSIADIFDALTASDRPYKKAIPTEKALDILGFEVKDGHVDGDLVKIFRESRVWETLGTPQNP